MTREEMSEKLGSVLPGLVIRSFRLVVGGTLILHLTHESTPQSSAQKSTRLWIESAWRLGSDDMMIAGSLDKPEFLMPHLPKLTGLTIDSVRLDGTPCDIRVILDSGLTIEGFNRSIENEQWEVRRPDGLRLGLRGNLELYEVVEEPD